VNDKIGYFFYLSACEQRQVKTRIHFTEGFTREIEGKNSRKVKPDKREMGVTKEQVESSLNSKLNPSHLVSFSFPVSFLSVDLLVYITLFSPWLNFNTIFLFFVYQIH